MTNKILLLLLMVVATFSFSCTKKFNADKPLDYCVVQVEKDIPQLTDDNKIPNNILKDDQSKNWNCSSIYDWKSGFWPGILWYTYEYSHDEKIKQQAERFSKALYRP